MCTVGVANWQEILKPCFLEAHCAMKIHPSFNRSIASNINRSYTFNVQVNIRFERNILFDLIIIIIIVGNQRRNVSSISFPFDAAQHTYTLKGLLSSADYSNRYGLTNEDLNRRWSNPNQVLHPVIYHTKGLMEYCTRVLQRPPYVFVDYHGHSRRKNVFLFGCSRSGSWSAADRAKPDQPAQYLVRGNETTDDD